MTTTTVAQERYTVAALRRIGDLVAEGLPAPAQILGLDAPGHTSLLFNRGEASTVDLWLIRLDPTAKAGHVDHVHDGPGKPWREYRGVAQIHGHDVHIWCAAPVPTPAGAPA